jgi:hypothetical protein
MKICYTCKYHKIWADPKHPNYTEDRCLHPDNIDMVTGLISDSGCYDARYHATVGNDNFVCGPDGKYWEEADADSN